MRVNDAFVPVTIAQVVPQEIIRYKNKEKDGYFAAVFGAEKKEAKTKTKKEKKTTYKTVAEFPVDENFIKTHEIWKSVDMGILENVKQVEVVWTSKGKWYQWVMKIFHTKGWPKTHGSKFHRHVGSMGNRKPRRTQKWHPHAAHLGNEQVTVKKIQVIDTITKDKEQLVILKWSLPGAYNGMLKLRIV